MYDKAKETMAFTLLNYGLQEHALLSIRQRIWRNNLF